MDDHSPESGLTSDDLSRAIQQGRVHGEGEITGISKDPKRTTYHPERANKIEKHLISAELLGKDFGVQSKEDEEKRKIGFDIVEAVKAAENLETLSLTNLRKDDVIALAFGKDESDSKVVYLNVDKPIVPHIIRPGNFSGRTYMEVSELPSSPPLVGNEGEEEEGHNYRIKGASFGGSALMPGTIKEGLYMAVYDESGGDLIVGPVRKFAVLREDQFGSLIPLESEELNKLPEQDEQELRGYRYFEKTFSDIQSRYFQEAWDSVPQGEWVSASWRSDSPNSDQIVTLETFGNAYPDIGTRGFEQRISIYQHSTLTLTTVSRRESGKGEIVYQVQEFHQATDPNQTTPYSGKVGYEIGYNYSNTPINNSVYFHNWNENLPTENFEFTLTQDGTLETGKSLGYRKTGEDCTAEIIDGQIIIGNREGVLIETPVDKTDTFQDFFSSTLSSHPLKRAR